MDANTIAIIAIIVGASSEVIALLPCRSNSLLQLLMSALRAAFPKR